MPITAFAPAKAGYLARPVGAGPWPGVVLLPEIFGLTDDIRALADRFAGRGYLTLAPDFYDGGKWTRCVRAAFRDLSAGKGPYFEAIEAARTWLAGHDESTGKVGVIGSCLGGGFALMVAPAADWAVASANYGEVPEDAERVLAGSCPIVASYGGRDRTTRGRPERLEAALTSAGVEHDVKTYPEAGHSFLATRPYSKGAMVLSKVMSMNAGPHEASARDAWERIDGFFAAHLQ